MKLVQFILLFLLLLTPVPVVALDYSVPFVEYETAPAPTPPQAPPVEPQPPKEKKAVSPRAPIVATGEIADLIRRFSAEYGFDAELALRIAKCESGLRADAQNSHSTASGTFQFINATWVSTRNQMGLDPSLALKTDPVEGVRTGVWKLAHGGIRAWDASRHCWSR